MLATVKAALRVPLVMEQVAWVTGVPDIEQEVSLLMKPRPETCTVVAGLADDGVNVIDGGVEFTVKSLDAESPA